MASFAYTPSQIDGIELMARVDRILYSRGAQRPNTSSDAWTASRRAAVSPRLGTECLHGASKPSASNEHN